MSYLLRQKDPWRRGYQHSTYFSLCGDGKIVCHNRGRRKRVNFQVSMRADLYIRKGDDWHSLGTFDSMQEAKDEFHKRTSPIA